MAALVVQTGLVVYVGGDWKYLQGYWRLLSTVAPICLVLGLALMKSLLTNRKRVIALIVAALCLSLTAVDLRARVTGGEASRRALSTGSPSLQSTLYGLWRFPQEFSHRLRWLVDFQDEHPEKVLGEWLRSRLGPDGRYADCHAGRIPYYSRLGFIDYFGYTDRQVIRLRLEKQRGVVDSDPSFAVWNYVFGLSPDAVIIRPKTDAREFYESFVDVADRNEYGLAFALRYGSSLSGPLVFSPVAAPLAEDDATQWVKLAGRRYPLKPGGEVRLPGFLKSTAN